MGTPWQEMMEEALADAAASMGLAMVDEVAALALIAVERRPEQRFSVHVVFEADNGAELALLKVIRDVVARRIATMEAS